MKLFYFISAIFIILAATSCQQGNKKTNTEVAVIEEIDGTNQIYEDGYQFFYGPIEGTTFSINYKSDSNYNKEIFKLLKDFEKSLSTYDENSVISRINNNDTTVVPDAFFTHFFNKSVEISDSTNKAFDITVAPLVNAWGFGFTGKEDVNQYLLDSILEFVGIDKVKLSDGRIEKTDPRVMLDGSAIAKGYSVDVAGDFLANKGISDYMVEIGGEVTAKGENSDGNLWRIGIDKPIEDQSGYQRELQAIIGIKNTSIATSGNYRQFYIEDGQKYSHTINPFTGRPAKNNLLSASVVTSKCIDADAYATAFMVLGFEKSKIIAESNPDIEAYFIFSADTSKYDTYATDGFQELIIE